MKREHGGSARIGTTETILSESNEKLQVSFLFGILVRASRTTY
jgi:hypothetical protein